MEFLPPVVAAASAVLAVGAAAYVARCATINVVRRVKDLGARVEATEASLETLERKWTAARADLGTLAEEIEGYMSEVERKRRKAAAAAARADRGANGQGQELDRDGVRRLAASRGIPV